MNNNWLESVRFNMEGIETLQNTIVKCMFQKQENSKEAVITDHKIDAYISMIHKKATDVKELLRDADGIRKEELSVISGQKHFAHADKLKGSSEWDNFYGRMKEIKETHKKFVPLVEPPSNSIAYFNKVVFNPPNKEPDFSQEESKGKFVDMHSLYLEYLNLHKTLNPKQDSKFGDYLWYLQNFDKLDQVPIPAKMKNYSKYESYLTALANYLNGYLVRVRPLVNTSGIVGQFQIDFQNRFLKNLVPGWEHRDSEEDKSVYCFDCKKVFVNEDTYLGHLNGKKHLKAASNKAEPAKELDEEETKQKEQHKKQHRRRQRDLALLEYKIGRFRSELANNIFDTMNLVRKKQTRGYEVQEDVEVESEPSEVDPDEPIYNPKNLPLGWDGKPIPYWLYKLHGLGIEYKCQICGNYSYWGRRAFQMHFQQWRHTYGMKCLKIPNTIHFKDVTKIQDALALHQKLLQQAQNSQFRRDAEQEFQDNEGNVINRKTYFDMKKQGLLG